VEFGHRRTLAAIEAGLATVPVIVVADEQTDTAGQVERIVRQYAENEHRTGLTETDRLGVVEQLSLLKVSAAQIAKRTKMKRPQVDQALAVTKSELAKAASARYELTLD
jgi:ParB family chromosome partitioning protein